MKRLAGLPFPVGAHTNKHKLTHAHTHSDTGIRFLVRSHWLQYVYYSASQLQSSYQTYTHAHTVCALLVNCGVLIKNWSASCCVSLLRWGIHYLFDMHRCVSRTRTQFTHPACLPASNPDLSNKTTPFRLEYLRRKQTNAPLGERKRED